MQLDARTPANITEEVIANNTKDILNKIAELHKKQGLTGKRQKKPPPAIAFPFKNQREIRLPESPFQNPIFDYLQANLHKNDDEEQTVRRKVTHQQSMSIIPMAQALFVPIPPMNPPEEQNKTSMVQSTIDNIKHIVNSQAPPVLFAAYYEPFYQPPTTRQQIQWPWSQYFPIIVKDPFIQMFNALTSMVEYGPTASCREEGSNPGEARQNKSSDDDLDTVDNDDDDDEDDKIPGEDDDDNLGKPPPFNPENLDFILRNVPNFGRIKPSSREPDPNVTAGITILKDDAISTNHNKKLFSKDDTGSGIFIDKLKVKAGGVAIAGPGGVATAGSGGTAIVGPNGLAYTQPGGLAIAGTGSRVIAVDPSVDLEKLVSENATTEQATRTGRVVAVGPTVYFNRG